MTKKIKLLRSALAVTRRGEIMARHGLTTAFVFILAGASAVRAEAPLVEAEAALRAILGAGASRVDYSARPGSLLAAGAQDSGGVPPSFDYCAANLWSGMDGAPVYGFRVQCKGNPKFFSVGTKWCWAFSRERLARCMGELTQQLEQAMLAKGYVKLATFTFLGQAEVPRNIVFGRSAGPARTSDRFCMAFPAEISYDAIPKVSYLVECAEPPDVTLHDLDIGEDTSGISRYMGERGYSPAGTFHFNSDRGLEPSLRGRVLLFRKPLVGL